MLPAQFFIKRSLATQSKNIGHVFFKDNVQKYLKDITRFDEAKVFARRPVPRLKSPRMIFMTDEQLEKAKQQAYENAISRLQMPPVLAADDTPPTVLAKDEELVGYTKYKVIFVDISTGQSDRTRLMSVREPDGTLRFPNYQERTRLNHMFYPGPGSLDAPLMFEGKNLERLLQQGEYQFILSRACVEFEPDDPRYVDITNQVYSYIDKKGHYDKLRSTRFFGPMALSLVYHKQADNLLVEMLSTGLLEDAAKVVRVYNECHSVAIDGECDDATLLQNYVNNHSTNRHHLELALQSALKDK